MTSGRHGWFITPSVGERDQIGVVWLPRKEAENVKEAIKVHDKALAELGLGIAIRYRTIDGSSFPAFGVRPAVSSLDALRAAIQKKAGFKYLTLGS